MKPRAFVLIAVLMVCILMTMVGMAFLGKRSAQYRASHAVMLAAQARALAEAGLEDARIKLEKDLNFPPPGDQTQTNFTYSEPVPAANPADPPVGFYFVTVETSWRDSPNGVPDLAHPCLLSVVSEGRLGPDFQRPLATTRIMMEVRYHDDYSAPFRITNWVDEGQPPAPPP